MKNYDEVCQAAQKKDALNESEWLGVQNKNVHKQKQVWRPWSMAVNDWE